MTSPNKSVCNSSAVSCPFRNLHPVVEAGDARLYAYGYSCDPAIPLKKREEVAGRAKQLVREKNEATAKTRFLEREASELRSLISLAESKVDEMLGIGARDQTPQVINAAVESKGIQQFGGSPTSPPKGRKSGFPRAFGLD